MDPLVLASVFFILAAALAAADLFVPSGGGLAIASLLSALASVYCAFRHGQVAGQVMLVLMLVAIPSFIVIALRVWPHTPIGRRIILKTPQLQTSSTDAAHDPLQDLVGQVGVAQSSLMPYGFVRIGQRNYNAMCDSGVIEVGQNVRVTGVQQRNLVVSKTNLVPTVVATQAPEPQSTPESLLDRPAEELGLDSLE